ncbi:TatD family hydrolase [Thiomicrospira microaerophila]|uniref:TatD family hydrolase n=1 Tax=Thiomicrospira microaerophila TaxID=406020 RepID=UPI00200F4294|nr:TatD family hydrolase [Thiomicrospira microaerophila]UQB41984.1 TatD family hydrolase [Thiomicrospira microaerophila]
MPPIIDTHAHLSNSSLLTSLTHPVVSVSVDLETSYNQLILFERSSFIFPAVGIHPWFCQSFNPAELNNLFDYILFNKISIIGEIGLDFSDRYKDTSCKQIDLFSRQLAFASFHGLSVSLHLYKAYDHMLDLLKRFPVIGVIHGFSGSPEQAKPFLDLGLKLGVNGIILRSNTPRYQRLVEFLPLSAFVIESDFPNVAYPKGLPPDLDMVSAIAKKIAEIKGCSSENVVTICNQNAIESLQLNVVK